MYLLTTMSNLRVARAFVDYMATLNITITLKPANQSIELWVSDQHHLLVARQELDAFIANPFDKKYAAASWKTGSLTAGIGYRSESYWHNIRAKAGPLTLSVIAICIIMYMAKVLLGTSTLMSLFSFPVDHSQFAEVWRWITPAFLHFSVLHIVFNLIWWWSLGGDIEKKQGIWSLTELFLLSVIISNSVQFIVSGSSNFGGLSGVVYALAGYSWVYGERQPQQAIKCDRSIILFFVVWLMIGYLGILDMPIANAAQLSGLLVGLGLAGWKTRKRTY